MYTYLAMRLPDLRQVQISDRDGEVAVELVLDQDYVNLETAVDRFVLFPTS